MFYRLRGAGIGGLTLSAALGALQRGSESSIEVDLYESASIISEIGAGITLWPRVWKIMKAIDLGEKLEQFLPRPPDDSTRKRLTQMWGCTLYKTLTVFILGLVFQIRKGDQPEGYFIHDIMMEGRFMIDTFDQIVFMRDFRRVYDISQG